MLQASAGCTNVHFTFIVIWERWVVDLDEGSDGKSAAQVLLSRVVAPKKASEAIAHWTSTAMA